MIAVVFTDHPSRGETSLSPGRFVPYSYRPDTISLFPSGPVPACIGNSPSGTPPPGRGWEF
jgi:hypothetical protein